MLLQGNLKEFNLPNVFQLVKMSAKTGALSINREGESGKIFFRNGQIYFATAHPGTMPLGERLVKSGHVTSKQLRAALAEQKKKSVKGRIGSILLAHGYIDRATLEQSVRDQIEDVTFNFFSWADGDFTFEADETVTDEDIHVEMKVESVIMEGCRRIDEWELIFATLGSLERVPRLRYNDIVEEDGGVKLAPDQWRVVCWVDGRHDINTVLKECGLDRFNGAKIIYDLHRSGLLTVSDSAIEEIGEGRTIVVRGPIDLYNQVFISTLVESKVTEHLRVELVDDREIEDPHGRRDLYAERSHRRRLRRAPRCGRRGARAHRHGELARRDLAALRRAELGVHRAGQRQLDRQPQGVGARPGLRAQAGHHAHRRGHLRLHGRGLAQPGRRGQDPRPDRRHPRHALQPARPRLGRGGR